MSNARVDVGAYPVAPSPIRTPVERLGDFGAALRRRWVPAVAVFALVLFAAVASTAVRHKTYVGTAQILLQPTDTVQSTISPGSIPGQADAERDVTTNTQLITSEPVAAAVRRELGIPITLPRLESRIKVGGAETSNLVSIEASDANPARAAQLATAFATQYQTYRREIAVQQINQALAAAESDPQSKVAASAVAARVRQLQAAAAAETGGVQIVRPATVPMHPASPKLSSAVLLGLVAGIALALCVVFGLEAVDRRLLSRDQFEDAFQAPVLAAIPPRRRGGDTRAGQVALERECTDLAARLAFTDAARDSRVIMLSPASSAEAAGPVALGLAQALATLGRRVMLIEADLVGRPGLRAGEPGEPGGLSAVLTGRSNLSREVTEMHFLTEAADGSGELEPWARVSYATLPSGPRVGEPEALLGRGAMRDVLAQAAERNDVVLVLSCPFDRPSGVLPLARLCDGAIVLARQRSLHVEQARGIADLLAGTRARMLGAVLLPADFAEVGPQRRGHIVDRIPRPAERYTTTEEGTMPALAVFSPSDQERG
jgi:capsular polysaccharide biosynthesis protein